MPLDSLEGTLAHDMSDLLSAEQQFAKALQQVAKQADSEQVRQMAEEHHAETLQHIENLKQAFVALGQKPEKMVCKGAQGIVEENNNTIKEEKPKGILKDIALVCGGAKIEHYEMSGYTAAVTAAQALGRRDITQLLQQNLKQEQATAKKLEAAAKQLMQEARSSAEGAGAASGSVASSSAAGGNATGGSKASSASAGGASKGGSKAGGSKASSSKAGGSKASAAKAAR